MNSDTNWVIHGPSESGLAGNKSHKDRYKIRNPHWALGSLKIERKKNIYEMRRK